MELINYSYIFSFTDGIKKQFDLSLDKASFEIQRNKQLATPDWAKLEENKCTHCPLKSQQCTFCPVALNLSDLVDFFANRLSYEKVTVEVITPNRQFKKETDLQDGIQSLFGLVMATSGCPHMNFLKPMAYYHLPFSQLDETISRTVSLYLLQQHFISLKDNKHNVDFKKLEAHYADVNQVNQGISKRFQSVKMKDSSKNGLVILDAFATMLPWEFADGLKRFEFLMNFQNTYSK